MQRRPGDPRRQMSLVRGDRRPVATLLQHFGEGRIGMALGEMVHDAERYLVQLEKDEASLPGQQLNSASAGAPKQSRHYGALSRTLSLAAGATTGRIEFAPPIRPRFGYGRGMCGDD